LLENLNSYIKELSLLSSHPLGGERLDQWVQLRISGVATMV